MKIISQKNLEKAGRILVFQSDLRYNIDVCYLIYGIALKVIFTFVGQKQGMTLFLPTFG